MLQDSKVKLENNRPFHVGFIPSILMIGHGVKIYGVAIVDELLPFFYLRYPEYFKYEKLSIGTFLGIQIILCSFFSLLLTGEDFFYKMHILWIGVCILFASNLRTSAFTVGSLYLLAAAIYFGCNLGFVLYEQIVFFSKEGAASCRVAPKTFPPACDLAVAYWQYFWTGTAYSALGLWISWAVIHSRLQKKNQAVLYTLFFVICVLQASKVALILWILSFVIFVRRPRVFLIIILSVILFILFETIFYVTVFLLNNEIVNFELAIYWHVIASSYSLNLLSELVRSPFDQGRLDQIFGVFNYIRESDLVRVFFGSMTGFHRHGITDYINSDSSGILRPIGMVTFFVDYGLLFVIAYTTIYARNIITIFRKIDWPFSGPTFLIIMSYSIFFLSPFVTNVMDSLLFWCVFFKPDILINLMTRNSQSVKN